VGFCAARRKKGTDVSFGLYSKELVESAMRMQRAHRERRETIRQREFRFLDAIAGDEKRGAEMSAANVLSAEKSREKKRSPVVSRAEKTDLASSWRK